LEVKGSVTNPEVELPPNELGKLDVGGFVGHNGKVSVVSDLGLKEPYVGLSNIVSEKLQSILRIIMPRAYSDRC
jgi:molecular chaperone Hsp33